MTKPTLILDRMQFFGRLARDYHAMFGVELASLRGQRILDCPAGPGSFVAEAAAAGVDAVGVDPLYEHDAHELRRRCEQDIAHTVQAMADHGGAYSDLNLRDYADHKRAALELFLGDYDAGRRAGRYVAASLPHLPFADRSFDRVFSAHLLVTYSDLASGGIMPSSPFTHAWHLAAAAELMRVARHEVRLYPTTTRTDPARRHPYIEAIVAEIHAAAGWSCRFEPSSYQRGNSAQNQLNAALVIARNGDAPSSRSSSPLTGKEHS